jgi:DNA end-binding protein Ku
VVKPSEIAALRPKTSAELEIASFVNPADIKPLFLDASYYVWPDRGGERPYALLYKALAESHYAALGALAMHGREYTIAILAGVRGLVLHTLFHANEVHSEEEYAVDSSLVGGKELEMARKLVTALSGSFEPAALTDKYEERLRALVESRDRLAHDAGSPAAQEVRESPPDLLEALRKSLEIARKPMRRESGGQPRQTRPKVRKNRTAS